MDWKSIMDDILQYDEDIVVVVGCADIVNVEIDSTKPKLFSFKGIENNFYRIIGRGDDENVLSTFTELACDVDIEGEYEFKAILQWISEEYDNVYYTRYDYLEVKHIEFNLIQTLVQRERNSKLEDIFNDDDLFLDNLFKF